MIVVSHRLTIMISNSENKILTNHISYFKLTNLSFLISGEFNAVLTSSLDKSIPRSQFVRFELFSLQINFGVSSIIFIELYSNKDN